MQEQFAKWKFKDALSLLGLMAAFLATHFGVLFQNKVYLNLWIFRNHLPFQGSFPKLINPLNQNSDLVTHYLANKIVLSQMLKNGFTPLWNPYVYCGFPLVGNGSITPFSPLNFLLLFFSPLSAYTIQITLIFLTGAFALYLLQRKYYSLKPFGAFLGALSLILCPFLLENIDFDSLLGFIWAYPITLLLLENCFAKRRVSSFLLLSLFLGLTAYMMHVHIVLMEGLLCLAYSLIKLFFEKGEQKKKVFIFLCFSALLFAGLAAASLFPFLEFLLHSQRNLPSGSASQMTIPIDLIAAFYPIIMKIPHLDQITRFLLKTEVVFDARGIYIGILPLFAAFFLLFSWRRGITSTQSNFFLVLVFFYLLISPVARLFLPFYDLIMARLWTLYIFSSALVLAFAIDLLIHSPGELSLFKRCVKGGFFLLILPVTLVSASFTFLLPLIKGKMLSLLSPEMAFLGQVKIENFMDKILEIFSIKSPFVWVPFVTSLSLLLLRVSYQTRRLSRASLFILFVVLVGDGFLIGEKVKVPPVPQSMVFQTPKAIAFLKDDPDLFRFASLQNEPDTPLAKRLVLKPNLGAIYGLYDIGGQESLLDRRYVLFARRALADRLDKPVTAAGILDFTKLNYRLAGMLNVKYILQDEAALPLEGLTKSKTIDGLRIYQNPFYLPRAFFVKAYESADFETILTKLSASTFEPTKSLYLEKKVHFSEAPGAKKDLASVQIHAYFPTHVEVGVEAPVDGFLFLSDTYYPGWKAFVDEKEVPIYRANGAFRAVLVPKGHHAVQFRYRPASLYRGALITGTTLLMMFAIQLIRVLVARMRPFSA